MHRLICVLVALCLPALFSTLRAQVCSPAETWDEFLVFFLATDEFTERQNVVRCVDLPERILVEILPGIEVEFEVNLRVTLQFEGEGAPGRVRIENGTSTLLLDENNEQIDLIPGVKRITVEPIRAGEATIFIDQNQGSGLYTPLIPGGKTFTVLEGALPVVWTKPLHFRQIGSQTEFTFGVADQRDVAGYTLERKEGTTFEPVQDIAYIENGSAEVIYRTELPALATDGYYRIRQTDFDGTASFSNTVFVTGSGLAAYRLFPNPTDDYVRLAGIPEEVGRIEIRGVTGRLVREIAIDEAVPDRIPVGDLRAGMYLVSLLGRDGVLSTERLLVR
ncbi:putative secreted protein (Por secretion system target) [Neolewinella xylanilytica]|uniref:Putative secreted protein (Por secretion system target) n=1 Tax=Neolewinella xylanilytica TaxID=1514080 RepID=A0A2S6I6P0_9BACT|nr:T9SS type A sorting domain-containing protein [Neolewinella xylanilytica]PPK87154.1 putative secreted protein (Por secretion system target) [Neolewinella xylanilytica]